MIAYIMIDGVEKKEVFLNHTKSDRLTSECTGLALASTVEQDGSLATGKRRDDPCSDARTPSHTGLPPMAILGAVRVPTPLELRRQNICTWSGLVWSTRRASATL